MDSHLRATKLHVPPGNHHLVPRDRLVGEIERTIPSTRLVLVSAPAGYGKTTLLSQWAHESQFPVAWLTASAGDNDSERFLRNLVSAWEEIDPGIRESPPGLLLGGISPDREAVLAALITVANTLPSHTAFVLDDVHLIEDSTVYQVIAYLLDHLPPVFHFVLVGRGDPSLSLARLRARHELLELRAEDLQFNLDESSAFLHDGMKLELNDKDIASLHHQMEGWITGLQLVALSFRHRHESAEPLVVSGRHRHVADYLSEEVLANLPKETSQFLLATCILDRLSGALCDQVTGLQQSQQMLELLDRENLFVVPLDDSRTWFRYHRLFADFLQQKLQRQDPDSLNLLHSRASRWYLANDLPELAFSHAIDSNDVGLVNQILERYLALKMFGGEVSVVTNWLASLPESWLARNPELILSDAAYLLLTGKPDACASRLDDLAQLADQNLPAMRKTMARATAVRCFMACFSNDLASAESHANQAFRELAADDFAFRANLYHALGETYRNNGRWDAARTHYLKVLDLAHAHPRDPTSRLLSVHVFGALADLELRRGHLRNAERHWTRALEALQRPESWGHFPLPLIGWIHLRMGELFYEWNDLEKSRDYVPRGLERAELGGDIRAMIAGNLILARLRLTEGDTERATHHLDQARPLLEQGSFPDWTSQFERCQLELWLAENRLRTAVDWADRVLQDDALTDRLEPEVTQLAIARVLILKGDEPSLAYAHDLLPRLIQNADHDGRMGFMIEALALLALAHWKRGEQAGAMSALEHALRLAEPEGYVRLFADLGLPMARVLQEARARNVMPDYIARLLVATGTPDMTGNAMLPEPLSPRERDVLGLIAAGLTNREIAETLFVSPETVKKHTGNIYGKLGVHSRTAAVIMARSLDMLD